METLEKLISSEEQRIEFLLMKKDQSAVDISGGKGNSGRFDDIDYSIQKAYEQLAIYKIRREMGF